ncbi:hypothetical protein HMPREF1548_03319 [Clostridium sp. KLE 1755]|nr:hypothetical protein HMPREF1548_03319 [Clostridium sp. KLE 1755]
MPYRLIISFSFAPDAFAPRTSYLPCQTARSTGSQTLLRRFLAVIKTASNRESLYTIFSAVARNFIKISGFLFENINFYHS